MDELAGFLSVLLFLELNCVILLTGHFVLIGEITLRDRSYF